ncbi:hypothetical protein KBD87_03255 [Candidatus Saccharibacteria bacterium]|jgi:hypothetical protein|nr:hypothetical protein [Candidatus Saccharibacteria bacterium]
MDATQAKEILDKVVGGVFGYQNPLSLEQAMQKFAFDLRLPQQVYDATTNEPTWAISVNPSKFITLKNAHKKKSGHTGEVDWMIPTRPLNSLEDVLVAWSETNLTTTEREIDSLNISESDNIYGSENVYRSSDVHTSKNVLFCEGSTNNEYVVACSRSQTSSYSIRIEDSQLCTNSFNVIWSAKISNSFFIQDCYDLMDCMFCSHIAGKRFCIANMQYTEEEYNRIKQDVIRWILTS